MKKIIWAALASSSLALAVPGNAASLLFIWDYAPGDMHGITYQDGVLIQDVAVGNEYAGFYGLWNGQTILADFAAAFNIVDGSNNLLATYAPSGTAGSGSFAVPFLTSSAVYLAGGTDVVANGGFQTVYQFRTANDDYTLQFRIQGAMGAVPEPTTWAMMIGGLALVGASMRRRKVAVSFA
jgi:hypothetical protein